MFTLLGLAGFPRIKFIMLFVFIFVVITGCNSSSDSKSNSDFVKISGTAQKGLFATLTVNYKYLDADTKNLSESMPAKVVGDKYEFSAKKNQAILLEASGTFINESDGTSITLDKPLQSIVSVKSANSSVNINLATTLVAKKVLSELPQSAKPIETIIDEQELFVQSALGFSPTTQLNQLDYSKIQATSDIADPNLQLLLLSTGVVSGLSGTQFFASGFDAVVDNFLVATTPILAAESLNSLNGLSANVIYQKVREFSGYTFLPELVLIDSPVLLCLQTNLCGWITSAEPSISIVGDRVYEASGQARVRIRLSEASTDFVHASVYAVEDTATENVDYVRLRTGITFNPGDTQVDLDLGIIIDSLVEPTETIKLEITTSSTEYSILQGTANITILDGAPAYLNNQDASNMEIRSVEVAYICNSEGECGDLVIGNSLGISGDKRSLFLSKIDIAALCTDSTNCPEQLTDWLVDFYLVAKDSLGTSQSEINLGPYIYNRQSVQIVNQTSQYRYPWLGLGGSDIKALTQTAKSNNWDLKIEARMGQPRIVKATPLPSFFTLPSTALAGGLELDISSVFYVSDTEQNCPSGSLSVNGGYVILNHSLDEESGILCLELDQDDPTGNPATVVAGNIELRTGYLKLPEGVSTRFVTQYAGQAWISPALINQSNFPNYLHSEGWPFELLLSSMTLTPSGIEIAYTGAHYLMDTSYSAEDPRKNGQLSSNDIYYSGVKGQSGTLMLNAEGIKGEINVAQATGKTAFPKAQLEWQGFTQTIDQSRLQPVQPDITSFTMEQSTACSSPGCLGNASQDWHVKTSNTKLDGDGYFLANAINQKANQIASFGARANDVFAWSRPDDYEFHQNMKLAIPGYRMPANSRISDYLMAHLNETPADENLTRYPLGSDESVDGNYHPIGLSLGPEIYRNASGDPEEGDGQLLDNNSLAINNGVDPAFNLASSTAVKYVLRNAGLTGVFNVAPSSLGLNTLAKFYGYPLKFSRFAVRATDNQLDSYTWIDGQLALNGDAGGDSGLDIYFTNLEINCSARLGNVDLLYERCDDIDNNENGLFDENCALRLHSWNADMDIFGAGFSGGDEAQSCATASQNFTLNHQLYFKALNKPISFETQWDKDGYLAAQTSGELPVYRFDRSADGKGFPIKTKGAQLAAGQIEGDGYGWLEFTNTQLGVNFWNALEADIRVANSKQFEQLIAEPTVVLPKDALAAQQTSTAETNKQLLQRTINQKVDIFAKYQWGKTGFGFELPVYYQPYQLDPGNSDVDAQGRQSRFVGRPLVYDLFVMDANAGINFIEPERTKLSFGASADFERLGNISFQVDPTDPNSAKTVDDLLISLNVINSPVLAPALNNFLSTVDVINRAAGRGLDELIQKSLELSLENAGSGSQDPFVALSETMALMRNGPQQAVAVLADEIKTPLNENVFGLEQDLRTAIEDLRLAPNLAKIDTVTGILNRIKNKAKLIDASLDNTVTNAKDLLEQAKSVLSTLDNATLDIDKALRQTVSFVDATCNSDFVLNAEGNGYLDQVAARFVSVRKLANIIHNSNAMFDVAQTLAQDRTAENRINTSKRRIREATTELVGYLNTADQAVRNLVCDNNNIDVVLTKAFSLTEKIRSQADLARLALTDASAPLDSLQTLHATLSEKIIRPIDNLSAAFEAAKDISVDDLIYNTDCILLGINTPFSCPDDNNLRESQGIDLVLFNLFGSVKEEAIDIIASAEKAISISLEGLLPGAYMTPQQLREMLATEIMRSTPIKELRVTVEKHFSEISSTLNGLVLQYMDQLNLVVETAIAGVAGPVNDALKEAKSIVNNIPVQAAGINGYATIAGNELERAHISAGWTMRGGDESSPTSFKAALDAVSWSVKNIPETEEGASATACALAAASSLLDVTISAYGLPLTVMVSDIELEKLYLGFTLKQNSGSGPALLPIGIFGGINTMGEIGFTDAVIIDPAFAAGLGELQTYIGASATANFSDLNAEVAFLVGYSCPGNDALTDLDPDAAKFITLPVNGFKGAYLRGGVTIPLVPGGCFLNLGVRADFGSWLLANMPTTFGGLVGGGAMGEVACIASIKGQVTVAGNASTSGDLKLVGDAWGVAGAGLDCDKGTWTSVQRSRKDSWCGTGDAQATATFENGEWDIPSPSVDMIF